MARNLSPIITELRSAINLLVRRKNIAENENKEMKLELERLKTELEDCKHQLDLAKMEVDFLTVSHRLADDPNHLISARRRLQRLIAKIDRCVSLLKDDADIC